MPWIQPRRSRTGWPVLRMSGVASATGLLSGVRQCGQLARTLRGGRA